MSFQILCVTDIKETNKEREREREVEQEETIESKKEKKMKKPDQEPTIVEIHDCVSQQQVSKCELGQMTLLADDGLRKRVALRR